MSVNPDSNPAPLPRLASEPLLPLQRGLYDRVEVVEFWDPAQLGPNTVGTCDQDWWVTRSAGLGLTGVGVVVIVVIGGAPSKVPATEPAGSCTPGRLFFVAGPTFDPTQ